MARIPELKYEITLFQLDTINDIAKQTIHLISNKENSLSNEDTQAIQNQLDLIRLINRLKNKRTFPEGFSEEKDNLSLVEGK